MSVFYDISTALNTHLKNMTSAPDIAWENKNYKPTLKTTYIRPTLLPADSAQATLGDSGTDMNPGIYQVDVFTAANKGTKAALNMADLIANRFKRGTDLTYNGRTVRIRSVSQKSGSTNTGGWYQIPIDITYISYTEART